MMDNREASPISFRQTKDIFGALNNNKYITIIGQKDITSPAVDNLGRFVEK